MPPIDVYLEIGAKRTFAGAVDWPGWCRPGKDPESALAALVEYGPAYAAALKPARLGFTAPTRPDQLRVVERLEGDATTDFGAPGQIPAADQAACDAADLKRLEKILEAGWRVFDAARTKARGKVLTKGPRGGGRDLEQIVAHVLEADTGYLSAFGFKPAKTVADDRLAAVRAAIVAGLAAWARGEIAPVGPRGGRRWPARYFARRSAWHTFAHAWEIERRLGA